MAVAGSLRKKYPAWAKESAPLTSEREPSVPSADTAHKAELANKDNQEQFRKIQEWWLQARESQSFVRLEMDVDENFYHGDQYTSEDRAALEAVGQAPLVFNKVKPVIDWIIGTERRTKVDGRVLPRKKGHEVDAKVKTDVLKYISDVNKEPFHKSEAFKEAAVSGLGWLEAGVRRDSEEDPVFVRQESWRNVWYDPLGTQKDTSDWRYLFRSKWTDLDIATAMFPTFASELRAASTSVNIDLTTKDDDEFYIGLRFSRRDSTGQQIGLPNYTEVINTQVNNRRERVRLVEAWYRMPVKGQKVKGGKHHGRVVNLRNQKMMYEVNDDINKGYAVVYDAVVMKVRCAVFCEGTLLQNMDSPYHHNKFPFIPVWAYRKGKFHEPYGGVRNIRDPQEDLNKRYSKALFILANTRIIADRNAVQDWEALREEAARPDGLLLLDTPKARFEVDKDKQLAEEQVKLMHADGIHIMESAGVTPENLGRDTNAISGRAVLAKQTQGSVVSAELFDNLRYSYQLLGEMKLSLAEQFYDQPKAIRISGERGGFLWHEINTPDKTGAMVNDITATQMDYIVAEQDFRDSMRQAMFESLSDALSKMQPEVQLALLDAVVDLTDFPGKQELISRIRKINGQLPPESEMTPQEREEAKKIMAAKQQQAAIAQRKVELDMAEIEAKADKMRADAEKTRAEIQTLGLDGKAQLEMERKVFEVEKQIEDERRKAADQLSKAHQQLANKHLEMEQDRELRLKEANISAETAEREAKIKAEAEVQIAEIEARAAVDAAAAQAGAQDQLNALKSQVDHHKGETQRVAQEAEQRRKQEADMRSESEQKAEKVRKETEDRAKQKMADDEKRFNEERQRHKDEQAKAKEEQAQREKDRAEKDKKAESEKDRKTAVDAAKAGQPININVTVAAGGEQGGAPTKSKIVKGKDGVFHVETTREASKSTSKISKGDDGSYSVETKKSGEGEAGGGKKLPRKPKD